MHMSEESPPLAAAVMIQLGTYLRPSEVLSLRKDDVFKPVKKPCQYWGVVVGNSQRNQVTKTGMQDDTVLLNSEDGAYTADILSLVYHRAKGPSARLFGDVTLSQYEELMRKARIKAGLGHYQLTPHAIRHSGPSIDCLQRTRSCDGSHGAGQMEDNQIHPAIPKTWSVAFENEQDPPTSLGPCKQSLANFACAS